MRRFECGACHSSDLIVILDLGSTPLADYFPSEPNQPLNTYRLELALCGTCGLAQLMEVVPDKELFGSDYSFFSGTSPSLVKHFREFARWATRKFPEQVARGVTEIACNDGTLLGMFPFGSPMEGIDPSGPPMDKLRETLPSVVAFNEPFTSTLAEQLDLRGGLVIANNVMAHVTDLDDFVKGIATLVGDKGVFVGEFQYLSDLLTGNAFDMIYHEHRYYLSLSVIENLFWRNGLLITEAMHIDTQGGSLRIVAHSQSGRGLFGNKSVRDICSRENFARYDRRYYDRRYADLQGRVDYLARRIHDVVEQHSNRGTVAGYAASAKSTTLLNYCGIDRNMLDYVVDTTPHKFNKFTPGTNIPILSTAQERVLHGEPDAYLLLASNYLGGVIRREFARNGNCPKLIVPLPAPVVI